VVPAHALLVLFGLLAVRPTSSVDLQQPQQVVLTYGMVSIGSIGGGVPSSCFGSENGPFPCALFPFLFLSRLLAPYVGKKKN